MVSLDEKDFKKTARSLLTRTEMEKACKGTLRGPLQM